MERRALGRQDDGSRVRRGRRRTASRRRVRRASRAAAAPPRARRPRCQTEQPLRRGLAQVRDRVVADVRVADAAVLQRVRRAAQRDQPAVGGEPRCPTTADPTAWFAGRPRPVPFEAELVAREHHRHPGSGHLQADADELALARPGDRAEAAGRRRATSRNGRRSTRAGRPGTRASSRRRRRREGWGRPTGIPQNACSSAFGIDGPRSQVHVGRRKPRSSSSRSSRRRGGPPGSRGRAPRSGASRRPPTALAPRAPRRRSARARRSGPPCSPRRCASRPARTASPANRATAARRRSSGELQLTFGSVRTPSHALVVRQPLVEVEELRSARSGRRAATNQSCPTPTWFSVRSPITRIPRPCGGGQGGERIVASEQRVDLVERSGVVAVRARGREDRRSGRSRRRRAAQRGPGAPRPPRGRHRRARAA